MNAPNVDLNPASTHLLSICGFLILNPDQNPRANMAKVVNDSILASVFAELESQGLTRLFWGQYQEINEQSCECHENTTPVIGTLPPSQNYGHVLHWKF